ncbi:MAG: molybdopterin-dependent oxidoreductase, partial [Acidobacteriota bacterium]|nr:molybdopterin-dependent oxidoreductase [Acidobacteriota bacterium]
PENGTSMNQASKNQKKLPVHEFPRPESDRVHSLRVDGLVHSRLELILADLQQLSQHDLVDDFTCLEGWSVPKVQWSGILLKDVLSFAKPLPEARYVQASAGNFSFPLPLERAGQALLAIRLDENLLSREHGGPVRLIVPGGDCFTSIKWLDRLELLAEPGPNTAKEIALGRLPATEHGEDTGENDSASSRRVSSESSD